MSNTPLVSILMNCYNGEKYIHEAITSIIDQTYQNWELLFWDNISTDKSKEIFESFEDSRLKYFLAKSHTNLGEARNLLLKKSKGKFIAFLDCDDLYFKDKISKQVAFMKVENLLMSYGSAEIINSNGGFVRVFRTKNKSGYIFGSLLMKYEINMQTVMLDEKLLVNDWCNFDSSLKYSPDHDLFMQVASRFPVGVIKDVLVKYRVYKGSLSIKMLGAVANNYKTTLDKIFSENPKLMKTYSQEANFAYKKGNFYDAIFYVSELRYKDALKSISIIKFSSYQFFCLYLMILIRLPKNIIMKILRRS